MQVVARAANGQAALDELKRTQVDVVVLDIEMPVMDGMTALPLLLRADPGLRVIMASHADHARRRHRDARAAARRGGLPAEAVLDRRGGDDSFRRELLEKVKGLARLRRRAALPRAAWRRRRGCALRRGRRIAPAAAAGGRQFDRRAAGAVHPGAGRWAATLNVPVVLTQHMPATFTPILAEHLGQLGGMPCAEAQDGEALQPGRIYLAPGDRHLLVETRARRAARAAVRRAAGEFLPPLGRSDAAQRRRRLRRARAGGDADRHGPGRPGRHARAWSQAGGTRGRAGRGHQRGLGHARRDRAGRAVPRGAAAAARSRRSCSTCCGRRAHEPALVRGRFDSSPRC